MKLGWRTTAAWPWWRRRDSHFPRRYVWPVTLVCVALSAGAGALVAWVVR